MKKWLRCAIIAIIVRTTDQANTCWRYKDTEESESEKSWGQRILRIKDFEKNIVVFQDSSSVTDHATHYKLKEYSVTEVYFKEVVAIRKVMLKKCNKR